MPGNTVHGPYVPTTWSGTTGINITRLNNLETQASAALHSINPDLIAGGFILSGLTAWKDGTTATQLDVAAGSAYVVMSDGTAALISCPSSTQTTSAPSSTYHLYLQPDGTWYWDTLNSPATNSVAICTVTTDGAGAISAVSDARSTSVSMLSGAAGSLGVPAPLAVARTQSGSLAAQIIGGVGLTQRKVLAAGYSASMLFNGSTGYLAVPTTSGFPTGNPAGLSLECWVYMTANPSSNVQPIAYGTRASHERLAIVINSTGQVQADTYSFGTAFSPALSLNAWHHLVATWDGTTLTGYADGGSFASATPGAMTIPASGNQATIGADVGPTGYFAGNIAEAAFYASKLTATRVSNHYSAGTSTAADNYVATVLADSPLLYYRLNDPGGAAQALPTISATQTTLVDASGAIKNVGGMATAGGLGVAAVIARSGKLVYTSTSQQFPLILTAPADGLYRANLFFVNKNPTPGKFTCYCAFTDSFLGTSTIVNFEQQSGGTGNPGQFLTGSQTNAVGSNQAVVCTPIPFECAGGQQITISTQDPGGTPNYAVWCNIERLE